MSFTYILLIIWGLISAFLMGRWGTLILLRSIRKVEKINSAFVKGKLDQENIHWVSIFGGAASVFLFLVVLVRFPQSWFTPLLILCLGYGIYSLANVFFNRKSTIQPKKITEPIHTPPNNPTSSEKAPEIDLDELFNNKNWEWDCFRTILILLVKKRPGKFIPAGSRPNYVHLDGLLPAITELRSISALSGNRETSRAVFVDTERTCLVISGKTRIGTTQQVKIDLQPEPGRENVQIPILTMHVHPVEGKSQGLSDLDYTSFLTDRRQMLMMICYQGGILFAMKTSATNNYSADVAKTWIEGIRNDILRIWSSLNPPEAILAFNKAVCLEFGLTLYRAPESNENVAHRIDVTNL